MPPATEGTILILFIIASAVAVVARRWGIPYTVALVLAGLLLSALQLMQAPQLTRDLLFLIFLPGLIFEAAYHIRFGDLWSDRWAVLGLAVPGVALTIGVTAVLLVYASRGMALLPHLGFQPMSWPVALLFGAAVAATDPISVVALFERLGAPQRLTLLIKGESLLNDGTAIVFFGLVLTMLLGGHTTLQGLSVEFLRVVGAGMVTGLVIGLLAVQVLRHLDDPMVAITITTVAAYAAFLVADRLGVSGVISTLTAGLVCGHQGLRGGLPPSLQVATDTFWEYMGFALNSLIFLLMGLESHLPALWEAMPLILLAYLAMTLGRFVVVGLIGGALAFTAARIPRAWLTVLSWGGLRGALSMVLVLSLPESVPGRATVVTLVFGVVLLSILLQGLTMTPLARRLGLLGLREALAEYEVARARLQFAADVIVELSHLRERGFIDPQVIDTVEQIYRQRMGEANEQLSALALDPQLRFREELVQLSRQMLQFEKSRARELWRAGQIGAEAYHQLVTDIDARLLQLESGEGLPAAPPAEEGMEAAADPSPPPDPPAAAQSG